MSDRFSDYERLVFLPGLKNSHIIPWGQLLVRNVDNEGKKLITFKDKKQHRKSKLKMWVECQLLVFRESNQIFPLYQCKECHQMEFLSNQKLDQNQQSLEGYKCAHSKEKLQ